MTSRHADPETASTDREANTVAALARGAGRRVTDPSWLARASAVGLCLASLAFGGLLVAALATGGATALVAKPLPLRVAILLPYLVAVLALGTLAGAVRSWRRRDWSLVARLHQTILALLGLGFVWQLVVLGFLP